MRRAVRWSGDALDDIDRQIDYIAAHDPDAATRVADHIEATGESLGDFATGHQGRVRSTYEKSVAGLPYIIVYRLETNEGGEVVTILRIIHTSRDWPDEDWPT